VLQNSCFANEMVFMPQRSHVDNHWRQEYKRGLFPADSALGEDSKPDIYKAKWIHFFTARKVNYFQYRLGSSTTQLCLGLMTLTEKELTISGSFVVKSDVQQSLMGIEVADGRSKVFS
jgi:hypothetical protein